MIHIKIKYIFISLMLLLAFAGGIYVKSALTSSVAIVNLEYVLSKSKKLSSIREENKQKLENLSKWVSKVNQELKAQTDTTKQNQLVEQYKKLTHEKEQIIKYEHQQKLKEINNEITSLINKVAKQQGCKIVLINTSVISGGKDITSDVLKLLHTDEKFIE